jgi:hypothetical protein
VGFITHFILAYRLRYGLEEKVPVVCSPSPTRNRGCAEPKRQGSAVCQVQTLEATRIAVAAGADIPAAQGTKQVDTGTVHLLPFLVRLIEEFLAFLLPLEALPTAVHWLRCSLLEPKVPGGHGFVATRENTEVPDPQTNIVQLTGAILWPRR